MTPSWWRPDRLATRRANLAARARMLGAVRDFFAARGYSTDARAKWQRLTVAAAFAHHAGIALLATAPEPARPNAALLAEAAAGIGVAPHPGDDWETLFFRIFLERIEPHLGIGAPT